MSIRSTNPRSWIQGWRLALAAGALAAGALLLVALQFAPGLPPKRGFYYWKTQWRASDEVLASLKANGVERFYMRFFDVGWDEASKQPHPVAPLVFESPPPNGVEIVPVVFLVNGVFLNIADKDIPDLADRVWRRVAGMAQEQGAPFHELQIDCDWTDTSRKRYFQFAGLLARKLKAEGKVLSATIRLHQIKYKERTGIPPVNRGMLMFYNFGKIQADSAKNSIFNASDAQLYISYIAGYPLELDVALPAFSWSVHSRDGNVQGLMEKLGAADVAAFEGFRRLAPNRFTASRSFFFRGRYFMEGDRVLVEETTPEMTREAAALAKRGAGKKRYATVALFDFDERHMENYGNDKLAKVWSAFQ